MVGIGIAIRENVTKNRNKKATTTLRYQPPLHSPSLHTLILSLLRFPFLLLHIPLYRPFLIFLFLFPRLMLALYIRIYSIWGYCIHNTHRRKSQFPPFCSLLLRIFTNAFLFDDYGRGICIRERGWCFTSELTLSHSIPLDYMASYVRLFHDNWTEKNIGSA